MGAPPPSPSAAAPIDVEALADRVYRLWLADLRLEQLRAPGWVRR